VTGRRRRRRKQLVADLKETRRYCKLKQEALDTYITYTWEVLKCSTVEEWGRHVGPIVWEKEVLLGAKEERGTSYVQRKKGRLTGLVYLA